MTEQGTPIRFTVSADEILTTIAVGYRFNGCSGDEAWMKEGYNSPH
jgi:hypothetical protein